MRGVAAVPAVSLLIGAALGIAFNPPVLIGLPGFVALILVASWAWWAGKPSVFAAAVSLAFMTGAALLTADAWRAARRPDLRVVFESAARQGRARATIEGRWLPEDDDVPAWVTGTLRADAARTESGVSLSIDAESINGESLAPTAVSGGVQATIVGVLATDRLGEWRAGRRVRLPVRLHRPARYLDPGVPDYELTLARRGTTLVGSVKSGALVEVLAQGGFLDEQAAQVRAFSRRAIFATVGAWSERSAGIVAAIVLGDRSSLDDEVRRRLQDAGTYHVIAISGGNIAILAGLMLGAFRLAGLLGRTARLVAIAILIAYARLVGGGASVDRATLMAVLYLAATLLDQRTPPLNTLAVAAACLVVLQPLSVLDAGFVLTFGATLAILVVMPATRAIDTPRWLVPATSLFAASLGTEAVLLPVGALSFARVTFAGLALNFGAIPLMAVVQIAGMILVPVALVSMPAASAIGYVAHIGAAGLIWTAGLVQFMPGLVVRVAQPSVWVVAIYYAALGAAWLAWRPSWRRGGCVVGALAAVWIVAEPWTLVSARGDGQLHLTFLDVGQGDSTFVRFPRGSTLLVDAGGLSGASGFDVGDRVVAPALREAGVRRLDVLALTHGDPDHIGGANAVLCEFRPREVWEGIPVPTFEPLTQLHGVADVVGARWLNRSAGDRTLVDGVDVIVRHPETADWERRRVRNDDSLVVELRWRSVSVVLPGDIGSRVELDLARLLPPAPVRVVKIPHHGSRTSSTPDFIRALAPTIAVASAGRSNHFGHPVPEVLQRYRDAGAQVFRTDQDGAVSIDTDGSSVSVTTFTGRGVSFFDSAGHHEATKTTKPQ